MFFSMLVTKEWQHDWGYVHFFNMQQKQLSNTNASVPFMCTFLLLAWQQEGVTIYMLTDC